ncbi:uncharacterized protein N7479_003886 [Penicillium vulpinum]|uniref:Uncharacterized protein n=1 Tax=Penicillium vulpinum TaxID=29845 RepID=A0A1V6RH55_9EURO|nr:uncharacterized protein N7479_003886 [Penicillium vulpinum]KAJ5964010.1 hypothetical protein N7479_003886 [Penicillium vulpinum]OQE00814.1 hypothetical protein PENVUL_c045G08014 [Penicillium vulpinum]
MASKLQDHIDVLQTLPLAEAIEAIADLIPGLTSVAPQEYGYFVQHPDYEGIGNLNDIGTLWLKLGSQCYDDHAPLKVRLVHTSMDDPILEVYNTSYTMLRKGLDDGTVVYPPPNENPDYCACCSGEASATILACFHERQALYFTEEEYTSLWGDQPNSGQSSRGWTEENGWGEHSINASRKQIEEALARKPAMGISSML